MSLDHHVVGFREVNEAVDRIPIVVPFGRIDERPFHLIFGREAVELIGKDSGELRIIEIRRIDRSRPNENILLACLVPQRRGTSARKRINCFSSNDERGDDCCSKGLHDFVWRCILCMFGAQLFVNCQDCRGRSNGFIQLGKC